MNSVLCRAAMVAAAVFSFASVASAEVQWIPAHGQWCGKVCYDVRRQPVSSGQHTADRRSTEYFFVCATNMNGWRPGYNLRPDWDDACYVGFGGKEVAARNYSCACE